MSTAMILVTKFVLAPVALVFIVASLRRLESASPKTQALVAAAWGFLLGSAGVFIFLAIFPKGTEADYALAVFWWLLAMAASWLFYLFMTAGVPKLGLVAGRLVRRMLRKNDFPVTGASGVEADRHKRAPFLKRV